MKAGIHPTYVVSAIKCATCGTVISTFSTKPNLQIEVCSKCHPFFTGQQRLLDTAGMVERFSRRFSQHSSLGEESEAGALTV
jgi:large subunit ribosomal protein L31